MDFNEIVEGATVYLPVAQPGALLYVGDGHAAQGDGELNGNALETSMDVEFTVDVIASKPLMTPRVESATHLMTVGLGGTLEDALRAATAGLGQWLEQDYQPDAVGDRDGAGQFGRVQHRRGRGPERRRRGEDQEGSAHRAQVTRASAL